MGKIDPSGKRFGVHGGLAIEQRRDAVRQRRMVTRTSDSRAAR